MVFIVENLEHFINLFTVDTKTLFRVTDSKFKWTKIINIHLNKRRKALFDQSFKCTYLKAHNYQSACDVFSNFYDSYNQYCHLVLAWCWVLGYIGELGDFCNIFFIYYCDLGKNDGQLL